MTLASEAARLRYGLDGLPPARVHSMAYLLRSPGP